MHLVQSFLRTDFPFSMTCTAWMFGLNWRRECRNEKLRVFPNIGFFPQLSQTAISLPLVISAVSNRCDAIIKPTDKQGRFTRGARTPLRRWSFAV